MLNRFDQEKLMKKLGFTSSTKFLHVNFLIWFVLQNNGKPVSKKRLSELIQVDERTIYRYVSENIPFFTIKKGFIQLKEN